jgi:hypothetical protein
VYNKKDTIFGGFNYGKKKARNKTTDNSRNGHSKNRSEQAWTRLVFLTDAAMFKKLYLAKKLDGTPSGLVSDLRSADHFLWRQDSRMTSQLNNRSIF